MKNLLSILLLALVFVGCTQKTVVVEPKQEVKEEKKFVKEPEQVFEEVFTPVEEEVIEDGIQRIAVLYPSTVVGKYAKSTVNTLTSFLLFEKKQFVLETFDSVNEDVQNIQQQILQLKQKGFKKIIAMYTQTGFDVLNTTEDINDLKIYFPLINKDEVYTLNENFIFGGISYHKQLELLHTFSSEKNSMFYVESYIGNKLRDSYLTIFGLGSNVKKIQRNNNRYKYIMEDERLKNSTVMLNTPVIKSSIIMSQLTAYEIEPIMILSTQLNYNPLLIKLTQDIDRTNFFVINSIGESDSFIQEYCNLLEADIVYNWVDYSSLVGVNYLINDNSKTNLIRTEVIANQAQYEPVLYRSTSYGFEKLKLTEEN